MTMISAYMQAEEVDPCESPSFYRGGSVRAVSLSVVWISDPGTGREVLPDTFESIPEFYRPLKELSDELDVEAVEDQNSFE